MGMGTPDGTHAGPEKRSAVGRMVSEPLVGAKVMVDRPTAEWQVPETLQWAVTCRGASPPSDEPCRVARTNAPVRFGRQTVDDRSCFRPLH